MNKTKKVVGGLSLATVLAAAPVLWGGYSWMKAEFPLRIEHELLAAEVSKLKLRQLYEKALREYYIYSELVREVPNNAEVKERFELLKAQVADLKRQLDKLEAK